MILTYAHTRRACYMGYVVQAINNNLTPLLFVIFQTSWGISLEQLSALILVNFATQLVFDLLATRYADRIGYRASVVLAHVFSSLGLVGLGLASAFASRPYPWLLLATMVSAAGGGLIEVVISPLVDCLPSDEKSADMSLLHSFYSWGQMVVILLSTGFIALWRVWWFLLPLLWAILPILNAFRFVRVPLAPPLAPEHKTPLTKLLVKRAFLLALFIMMCAGASEQAMAQWASFFAEKGLSVPKAWGDILGPCLFALFMGIGRTIYGLFGRYIPLWKALLGCSALCVVCYAAAAFAPSAAAALMGCALCGLAVSLMWPGILSLTAARYPGGGTPMFGLLAVMGDAGCALGPWFAGFASARALASPQLTEVFQRLGWSEGVAGPKLIMAVSMLLPILLAIGLLFLGRRTGENKEI